LKKRITVPFFIPHAGCPNTCVFCNQFSISGKQKRVDPSSIPAIVNLYKNNNDTAHTEIGFFGGTFTALPIDVQKQYLLQAYELKKNKKIHEIRLSTRPDAIDDKIIDLLKAYSVDTVELGVQSFSDTVLKAAKRGHSADDSIKAHKLLKKHGFKTGIQLMPGLPEDTLTLSINNAHCAVELGTDCVRIYPAVVIKDTELEQLYLGGKYNPLTLQSAVDLTAQMYRIFSSNNISVIRLGLHPLTEKDSHSIIAGPYHTSFGFLVKSRVRLFELEHYFNSLTDIVHESAYMLTLPDDNYEEYIGYKKENINYLEKKFLIKLHYQRGKTLNITTLK
jgi:histone acetyltransferase (RNA polymerase elongator complex component)